MVTKGSSGSGKQIGIEHILKVLKLRVKDNERLESIEEQLQLLEKLENVVHNVRTKLSSRVIKNELLERESDAEASIEIAGLYVDILANVIDYIKKVNPEPAEPANITHDIVDTILMDGIDYRDKAIKQLKNDRVVVIQDPTRIRKRQELGGYHE